jgi:integrase/recombinase XerD
MVLRKDRNKEFRQRIMENFGHRCCFTPSLVPLWSNKNKVPEEELNIKCGTDDKLKIYRKDGNIDNNDDNNILVFCPYHYGVVYHELRTMVKKKEKKRRGIREKKKLPAHLSKEEWEKLVTSAVRLNHKYGLLVSFMYYLGPRVSELVNIQKKDILLGKRFVIFRADITKRKKERRVTIPDQFVSSLRTYIEKYKDEDRIFKYTPQRVWQIIKLCGKKAGIKKNIHPHTMRHTYGTTIYNNTGDIKLTQELLGHENMSTTSIYAHISDEYKKEGVNKAFQ